MTTGSSRSNSFLEAAIAASRSRGSWNDRFAYWEKPPSDSEEAQIQRSGAMVRSALESNDWLSQERVEVRPQGSYHNNTNVRRDSDMDLCVWHPGIRVLVEEGISRDEVDLKLGYTSIGGFIPAIAANLRREIGRALVDAFGSANVRGGNKAFRLSAVPGSRADTDVVPAVCLHCVRRRGLGLLASVEPFERIQGVVVYATDGTEILNFPQQHHENGKAKRTRTKHRFKKLVRAAKRLRDELVEGGQLRPGQVPSFLIECLVYGVADGAFLFEEDRYDRMWRVLYRIGEQLSDSSWTATALEINGVKLLFHEVQPWTVADAQAFVIAALRRMVP